MLNIAASQQDGKEIKKVKQADNKCCQNQCLELSQAAKKRFHYHRFPLKEGVFKLQGSRKRLKVGADDQISSICGGILHYSRILMNFCGFKTASLKKCGRSCTHNCATPELTERLLKAVEKF